MGTEGAGWSEAKRAIVAALREGRYINDTRSDRRRNQLATGEVDLATVVGAVEATRGNDAHCEPYHGNVDLPAWILAPTRGGRRWYLKVYFAGDLLHVYSVHPEGMHPERG